MVYYNPHITWQYNPLYTVNTQFFSLLAWLYIYPFKILPLKPSIHDHNHHLATVEISSSEASSTLKGVGLKRIEGATGGPSGSRVFHLECENHQTELASCFLNIQNFWGFIENLEKVLKESQNKTMIINLGTR